MEDRVGTNMPSDAEVQQLEKDLASVRQRLEKYCVTLTPKERKGLLKMRPGGEAIAALVGRLATDHGVTLPGANTPAMNADLELARRLQRVETEVAKVRRLVRDTVLEAQSEAWWAATALYTALNRTRSSQPSLEADLQPAVAFFATGRRKNPVEPPT
jgi:hypothetical protein